MKTKSFHEYDTTHHIMMGLSSVWHIAGSFSLTASLNGEEHFVGRVAEVARAALTERSGSSTKGRSPNIRYLSRNLVLSQFTRFLKAFHRAFNESHPAFIELSKRAILFS